MPDVDHVDDGRVIESCEELAFHQKTIAPCRAVIAGVKKLDRDSLLNLAVHALGQIDSAHPAGAEQAD
jgi:hypothetical protein